MPVTVGTDDVVALDGGGRAPLTAPVASYVICTNPRSGSWLLSDGLAATALAGNPREWFNVLEEQQRRPGWNIEPGAELPYPDYLQHVWRDATTPNGVCGVKLHYYQLASLIKGLTSIERYQGLPHRELMPAAFPNVRYIWLTRRDKARQALSYLRASQTREWWRIDGVPRPADGRPRRFHYDPEALYRLEKILEKNEWEWQSFFADSGAEPLVIHYEAFAADYEGTLRQVLRWLAVPEAGTVPIGPPRLNRQSLPHDEQWLQRYLRYKARIEGGGRIEGRAGSVAPRRAISRVTADGALRSPLLALSQAVADPYPLAARQTRARLDKAVALLGVLHEVDRLSPRAARIERRSGLSREDFLEQYYAANRPVILDDLMTDCPARQLWTPEYLKRMAGGVQVEIMADRDADPRYDRNIDKHRKTMRFADYVDLACSGRVTNDYYLVANNRFFDKPETRLLLADVSLGGGYLDPGTADAQSYLWFGPAGTITPLHHDACNLLVAQILGRKHFRLIPAKQWPLLYTDGGFFSDVDIEKLTAERSLETRDVPVLEVTLSPGEVLFIPVGWSHHVRSLEPSISVSATNFVFPNLYTW